MPKQQTPKKPPDIWKKSTDNQHYNETKPIPPFETPLTNAIALDFRNTNFDQKEATTEMGKWCSNYDKIAFSSRTKIIQIGFESETERQLALKSPLLLNEVEIRKTLLHHESETLMKIFITKLSVNEKEEDIGFANFSNSIEKFSKISLEIF